MTRPRALIAEDEPLMRERLKEHLALAWPELEIVAEADDGDLALAAFEAERPDLAFLDIRMPGKSGLEVAAAIGADCHVVFVTAYDQHAIEAFEVNAVDYLLKPVDQSRLEVAVDRARRRVASDRPLEAGTNVNSAELEKIIQAVAERQSRRERLAIKAASGFCCPVRRSSTRARRALAMEVLIRTPLLDPPRTDPDRFWQIHRGTIVNAVAGVLREDAGASSGTGALSDSRCRASFHCSANVTRRGPSRLCGSRHRAGYRQWLVQKVCTTSSLR
jgi:DNA-binding LytR/AlgR family response regulator